MKIVISPERATQIEAPASNPMTDMCGTRVGFALSGLVPLGVTFTQGAALGWSVVAPSGRQKDILGRAPNSTVVHAGPLPRGEGEPFAAHGESETSRFLPTRRRVSPLPEGEGQGEGERSAERRISAALLCALRARRSFWFVILTRSSIF